MTELTTLEHLAAAAATILDVPWLVVTHLVGDHLVVAVAHGIDVPPATDATHAHPSPLCLEIATSGRAIVIQDARRCIPRITAAELGIPVGGYAGVALQAEDGRSIGSLAAITPERRAWLDRDLLVLRGFARAAAAVIETMTLRLRCETLERHASELEGHASRIGLEARAAAVFQRRQARALASSAYHDDLTGLLNRRGCFAEAPAQIIRARDAGAGGLVLFADVDQLKLVNDRDGHAAGDALLCDAADVLRACFRADDTIARIGGDEFVVVAFDITALQIPVIEARLAVELAAVNARRDPRSPLSWSLGLVAVDPMADDGFEGLVSAADRKMYLDKRRRVAGSTA